jgi:ribosomal-protein-alanine N-acetyltransferase
MVARPPVILRVEPMRLDDIPAVHAIESASFPTPWPPYAFRGELETNRMAHYLVVRAASRVVAYAGIWLMVDEAHVTTFAVLPTYRRRGIGGRLLSEVIELAAVLGATVVTLEVRLSNAAARQLYQRFGFRPVGVRPRYYSDNGEDALIMTTERLDLPEMTALRSRLAERYDNDALADDPGEPDHDSDDPPGISGR